MADSDSTKKKKKGKEKEKEKKKKSKDKEKKSKKDKKKKSSKKDKGTESDTEKIKKKSKEKKREADRIEKKLKQQKEEAAKLNPELIDNTVNLLIRTLQRCEDNLNQLLTFKSTASKIDTDILEQEIGLLRQQYIETINERNIVAADLIRLNPSIILSTPIANPGERGIWKIRDENFNTIIDRAIHEKPKQIKFIIPEKNEPIQKFNKSTRRYYIKYGLWIPISIVKDKNDDQRSFFEFHLIHGSYKMGVTEYDKFINEFGRESYLEQQKENDNKGIVENGYYATATMSPVRCLIENSSILFDIIQPINFALAFNPNKQTPSSDTTNIDALEVAHCGISPSDSLIPPVPFDRPFSLNVDDISIDPATIIQYQKTENDLDIFYDSLQQDFYYNENVSTEFEKDLNNMKTIPSRLTEYSELRYLDILPEELMNHFNNMQGYLSGISLMPRLLEAPTRAYISSWNKKNNKNSIGLTQNRINVGSQELYMTILSLPANIDDSITQAWLFSHQITVPGFGAIADVIKYSGISSETGKSKKKRKESTIEGGDSKLYKDKDENKEKRLKVTEQSMRKVAAIKRSGYTWTSFMYI